MVSITRRHTVMATRPGTAARPATRCRAATARRIKDPSEADGVRGTAVPRATRYRAATALPIKVRSAAIRDADGTAIGPTVTVDRSNHGNYTGRIGDIAS